MVDWAFLLEVLSKLGSGRHWTSMVCGLLGTASTRVVVNGVAGALIFNRHGLRKGDPLSPPTLRLGYGHPSPAYQESHGEGTFFGPRYFRSTASYLDVCR
jgi:hypothetical protein